MSDPTFSPPVRAPILIGVAVVLGMAALYWLLARSGLIGLIGDKAALRAAIERLGLWGPVAVVGMEALAIVASPLPSAPVALAAGAAYGSLLGTVLIVLGAILGAVIAFVIARCIGFEIIRRFDGAQKYLAMLGHNYSQRWLMGMVFVSRLLPFVSFDAVSYAAGLTPLSFWRFTLATTTGVVPVSFLLTYAGDTLIGLGSTFVLAVIVVLMALPLVYAGLRALWRSVRP